MNGRYSKTQAAERFLAVFPMDEPKYLVLVVLDEPKPRETHGFATAGSNAAPTVGKIIARDRAAARRRAAFDLPRRPTDPGDVAVAQ